MSRCGQTETLLDVVFSGAGLSSDQMGHATECAECARSLAQARRFEDELHRAGAELTPESLAPAFAMSPVATESTGGPRVRSPYRWTGAGVAAAIAISAVWVVGSALQERATPGQTGSRPSDDQVVAWAMGIEEIARRSQGLWNPAQPSWELVRSERCGGSSIAFFEGVWGPNEERMYAWGVGPIGARTLTASGRGETVDAVEVARLRVELPPCDIVVDRVAADLDEIGGARELWTSVTGEEEPEGEVRLIGATPIADGHRSGLNAETALPTFLVLLERQTDAAHWVEQASVSVTNTWAMGSDVGIEREGFPEAMRVFAEGRHIDETVFAWIDDERVRSVDIWIPREGVTLRYSVASPGFLARFDARVGSVDEMEYQFRDSLGTVIASGSVAPWPVAGGEE